MSDTSFPVYEHYGTNAERLAFVPNPPATGQPIYIWYETDTGNTYLYDTTWHLISGAGGGNINVSAGTTSQNLTNLVFSNSNSVSFGLNGSTITASVNVPAQVNFSAGTTSGNLGSVVFSNSNNVSFGLNGSTITATVTVVSTQGSINLSAGTTSNLASAFTFANSNGISFGLDSSTITASHNGITAQTNQTLGMYALSNTTGQSSSSTFDARTLSINAFGNISAGFSNGSIVISGSGGAGGGSINISAGTTSNDLTNLVFSNSNNVSFGLNGSTVTASVVPGGGGYISYYENTPFINTLVSFGPGGVAQQLFVHPFVIQRDMDARVIMHPISISLVNRTFGGTSATTSFTASAVYTFGYEIFTKGTGASSLSLLPYTTTTVGSTFQTAITAGVNGSQYTVSINLTYNNSLGNTVSFSNSYACSSGSFVLNSASLTAIGNGIRHIFAPFSTTLSGANYWMGFAVSTNSASQGATAISTMVGITQGVGASQYNLAPINIGEAATSSVAFNLFAGRVTITSQFFSVSGLPVSQITSANSNAFIPFQFRNYN